MRRSFFCLIVAGIVAWLGPAEGSITQPADTWVYPCFEELRLREGGSGFPVMTGPYGRLELARWISERAADADSPRSAWLVGILADELAPEIALVGGAGHVLSLNARGGLRLENGRKLKPEILFTLADCGSEGLSLWTRLRVTANWPAAHAVEARPWREQGRASFDYGGVGWRRGRWSLFAGRDALAWSSTRGLGLLLGAEAPTYDMVKLSVAGKHLVFTALHSKLRSGQQDLWPSVVDRFLSGHRVEALIGSRLNLSLSEVVVYGGPRRGFEFGYLNPLGAFYADQWNAGRDDNLLFGADAALLLPGRAEVRAEMMFDDFQIDPGSEPHKMGLGMSATAANPLRPEASLLGLAYCMVTNRTYGHRAAYDQFVQEGQVMGFPAGPDADRLEVWTKASLGDPYEVRLAYILSRRGEGRVDDPQDQPGRSLRFPSGIVESVHTATAEVSWQPSRALIMRSVAQWRRTVNGGNVGGANRDEMRFVLNLTYDFRWFRVAPGVGSPTEAGPGAEAR